MTNPYTLKSYTRTTYAIYFCGVFLREVMPWNYDYYKAKNQVIRANELFWEQVCK